LTVKWRVPPKVEEARIRKVIRDCPTPILRAEDCIRKAIEGWNRPTIAWSGGKCSTVVLHMAMKIDPDIKVVFNDTGVEFPETYAFVNRIAEEWNLNLEILKPRTTFWETVKKYGFPMLRGQYKDDSISKDGRPMCCQFLKEEPVKRAHITCMITGLRASESRMRTFTIAQYGQYYYPKTLKRWNFHPIALWDTEEVWKYHKEQGIPHNNIYDMGHDRCGCWPCTGYIGWRESLAKSHPEMYRVLSKMTGQPLLWEYRDTEKCRQEARADFP